MRIKSAWEVGEGARKGFAFWSSGRGGVLTFWGLYALLQVRKGGDRQDDWWEDRNWVPGGCREDPGRGQEGKRGETTGF